MVLVGVPGVGCFVSCRHVIQLVTPFVRVLLLNAPRGTARVSATLSVAPALESQTSEAVRGSGILSGPRNGRKDLSAILGHVNLTYASVVVVQVVVLLAMWLLSRHFGA